MRFCACGAIRRRPVRAAGRDRRPASCGDGRQRRPARARRRRPTRRPAHRHGAVRRPRRLRPDARRARSRGGPRPGDAALATMADAIERSTGRARSSSAMRCSRSSAGRAPTTTMRCGPRSPPSRSAPALPSRRRGEPLDVRIGIATGEVVAAAARRPDGDLRLTGEAITTAARIQSMARRARSCSTTRRDARRASRLATDPRGAVVLRGQSTAVELHALCGEAGMGAWTVPQPRPARWSAGRGARGSGRDRADRPPRAAARSCWSRRRRHGQDAAARRRPNPWPAGRGFAWTWTENVSYARGEPYRSGRAARAGHRRRARDRTPAASSLLLFPGRCPPCRRRRYGGAIAAIARDAAFSGWEAESA